MPTEKISWKDTNLALIGSDLDQKIRQAAGDSEAAWDGIGQAPGLKIWRIEQFKVKEWPSDRHSQFYTGDSYIVLNSYKVGTSDALRHDIHIWIGKESSQDEYGTAAYKMVEADDFLGGAAIQHRQIQGHEDAKFRSYFDTIEYLEGGIASGFRHVEPDETHPILFQVKGNRKYMTLTQVSLAKSSLNEGDSFILFAGKAKVWCWHGKSAKPLEKAHSNQWAEKMCTMGTVTTLDQGQGDEEYVDFWHLVGNDGEIGPHLDDDEGVAEFEPRLYRVDGDLTKDLQLVATGKMISKGNHKDSAPLNRSDLDDDDVFLVDSGWKIYIWIGAGSDRREKMAAMTAADRYAKLDARTVELPVHIIKAGNESEDFAAMFS